MTAAAAGISCGDLTAVKSSILIAVMTAAAAAVVI